MAKKIVVLAALLALLVMYLLPIGVVPGFFIGGTEQPVPAKWEDTSGIDEVRLRTGDLIPRVVIIWIVQINGELYVSGGKDSGWVIRLLKNTDAQLRIGDSTYAVTAERQTQNLDALMSAWYDKYQPNYPEIVGQMRAVSANPRPYEVFRLARP
tara:strand:+ start:60 stop:521 length:462 start_codon:yes stop_codon:yes gene_type:complete